MTPESPNRQRRFNQGRVPRFTLEFSGNSDDKKEVYTKLKKIKTLLPETHRTNKELLNRILDDWLAFNDTDNMTSNKQTSSTGNSSQAASANYDGKMNIQPTTESELHLYRVLQRANLLQYYHTFISQGGDDVQQLCEAGEDEFLEIMALVGMASKPLHVRRLQKSLQEWVTNPSLFQHAIQGAAAPSPGSIAAMHRVTSSFPTAGQTSFSTSQGGGTAPQPSSQQDSGKWSPTTRWTSSGGENSRTPPPQAIQTHPESNAISISPSSQDMTYPPSAPDGPPPLEIAPGLRESPRPGSSVDSDEQPERLTGSPMPTPVLAESQVRSLMDSAERLSQTLPHYEPKPLNTKKNINRQIEVLITQDLSDQTCMDELRKYAAIYGRFDSKRKNIKPMSLHEISVNEAAAQLCRLQPALLTRREDLFPLARQVVRDSGYQYSKGHSRAQSADIPASKKPKMDLALSGRDANSKLVKAELEQIRREERMAEINQEMERIKVEQEEITARAQAAKTAEDYSLIQSLQRQLEGLKDKQLQLLTEQSDIIRRQRRFQMNRGNRTGNNSAPEESSPDSLMIASGSSSPQNGPAEQEGEPEYDVLNNIYTGGRMLKANSVHSKKLVQETLFDEGLRIAHEYGLSDLAEEIRVMKPESEDCKEQEENNNPEWNPQFHNGQHPENVNGTKDTSWAGHAQQPNGEGPSTEMPESMPQEQWSVNQNLPSTNGDASNEGDQTMSAFVKVEEIPSHHSEIDS